MTYRTPAEQAAVLAYEDTGTQDDCTWYLAAARGEKSGPRLVSLCREMARRQQVLVDNTSKCIAVFQYGGDAKNIDPEDHYPIEEDMVSFNAAQNAVETVFSKVIKSRIAPMPLTNGGGYLQRHRAKQMGKAIEGVLDDNDCDPIEEDVLMDALVTDHGAGAIKVIECDDDMRLENVPIEDVWYDEAEIRQRQPRSQYHVPKGGIDKFVAIELYANDNDKYPGLVGTAESRRAAILRAAGMPEAWRNKQSPEAKHRVDIFESWHLPSGDPEEYDEEYEDDEGETKTRKAVRHDGRHVVAVAGEDGTLIDEPWCEDYHPILLMTPRKRRRSIWGLSLMRDFIAPQREYEKLTKKIQHQNQKMGVSGWAASKQSEIQPREITAGTFGAGFVMEFEGPNPPVPIVTQAVDASTYAYADSLPRNMLERKGISTFSANSQLPPGLSQASGKALQVFEDVEDVRLIQYHRARERWKVDLSWIIVKTAKRITERLKAEKQGRSFKARYRGKRGLEVIDWADVLMDMKDFVLKVFPISQLSKQPAAKFAQLTEMLNAQAITVEQFKRLFELPDLEAENELDSSDTDIIDRNMDLMVTTGRYLSPEPFDNLGLVITRAGKFYNLCRANEVPEDRLQLLRNLIEDAKNLKNPPLPAPMPGAAPPMGAPPPPGPMGMVPPDAPLPGMTPAMPPPAAAPPPPPMPMAA